MSAEGGQVHGRVGNHVERRRSISPFPDNYERQGNVAHLGDRRIGEHPLQVRLQQGSQIAHDHGQEREHPEWECAGAPPRPPPRRSSRRKATAAPLEAVERKATTGVGAPSYTSGVQRWAGTRDILKAMPARRKPAPASRTGFSLPLAARAFMAGPMSSVPHPCIDEGDTEGGEGGGNGPHEQVFHPRLP